MGAFVQEQLPRGQEGLPALGARVWSLPRVSQVMSDKRGGLGKPLPATAAFERVLARVAVEVFAMSALGFKALWALRTAEGPEVAVAALVPHKLSVSEKRLLAGSAEVWPLPCVDPLVACEAGKLGKALLAV